MKKILSCFFLIAFGISAGFADDAVTISRVIPSSKAPAAPIPNTTSAGVVARTAVSRGVVNVPPQEVEENPVLSSDDSDNATVARTAARAPAATPSDNTTVRSTAPVRTASRAVPTSSAATDSPRASAAGSRSGATIGRSVVADTQTKRDNLDAATRTVGRNSRVSSASINNSAAVRRAGITLRPSTAEVGGRATIAGTDVQTGSNVGAAARAVQSRAASTTGTRETITEATERLKQTADLNKSCQEQYNDCMDQFCAVIDANQKRCSCSSNLSRYTKVESAVKEANTQLNEVAQRIRYVGLSADEIRAIMSATEAENALSGTKDNTESRNMLDEIENLIKNPAGATSSYSGDSFSGLDMDLDFSADGAGDMFNLDFLGNNSSSFSNLRGADLYNAAKKRCNTVLNQCKGAGATTQQITGNYDLAIDKDCIAYEQGLNKMNESLKSNVRSANQMLQKARLAVLQNKNQYDAKGCIAALNTCMSDDMVCGADYTKCLDPTKKYIDENGKVVLGKNISDILAFMERYDNSEIDSNFLKTANGTAINTETCKGTTYNNGTCVVRYLLDKIGTGKTATDGGLCRAVLDKCQRYTYNSSSVYEPYNDVVVNYIQRAMVNVQAAQRKIISDYASNCMVDIAACYNQQVSQVNSWSSTASIGSVYNVMRGACRNVALTCSYAVFSADNSSCPKNESDEDKSTCIDSISEMFYQSLLCPDNSIYSETPGKPGTDAGYVNERCICLTGYSPWGKSCMKTCNAGSYRNPSTGQCDSCPGGTYSSAIDAVSCTTCKPNTYCPKGSTVETVCPNNGTSAAGSSAVTDCKTK